MKTEISYYTVMNNIIHNEIQNILKKENIIDLRQILMDYFDQKFEDMDLDQIVDYYNQYNENKINEDDIIF